MSVFRRAKALNIQNIAATQNLPGIYIIYRRGRAFYVGRSKRSIRSRLRSHFSGTGSRRVREVPNHELSFEAEALNNPVQAEAFLIAALGTRERGNLRWEFYGPDWEPEEP